MAWARSVASLLLSSFSPLALFAALEPGVWFDPSDSATLFQDSLGTTPVTTPGQPVGLILDKSQKLTVGPELLINGDFSSGTANWFNSNSTLSATGGVLTVTAVGLNYGIASQQVVTVPGVTYRVTSTVSVGTANVGWIIYGSPVLYSYTSTTPTVKTGYFVATGTLTSINIQTNNTVNNGTVLCGGISVKAIAGNHATQPTSGLRPYWTKYPSQVLRNLVRGAAEVGNSAVYPVSQVQNGITLTKAGSGIDAADGIPYVDYSVSGTASAQAQFFINPATYWVTPTTVGQTYTGSFISKLVAGSTPAAGNGPFPCIIGETSSAVYVENGAFSPIPPTATEILQSTTYTFANATTTQLHSTLLFQILSGATVNFTVRIKGLQFERSSSRSAYQWTYVNGARSEPLYRNLANGSADVGNSTYWPATSTVNGITCTKVASGIDTDGLPYVDARYTGTATGTYMSSVYTYALSVNSASLGQMYTASALLRVIAGSTTGVLGFFVSVVEQNSVGTYLAESDAIQVPTTSDTLSRTTRTLSQATVAQVRTAVNLTFASGTVIDVTYRVKGYQLELGSIQTSYQSNYNSYYVTETGVPTVAGIKFNGADQFLVTPTITPGASGQSSGLELITNGDFASGSTGWTLTGGWSVAGGVASSTGGVSAITQTTGTLTIGQWYVAEFDSGTPYTINAVFGSNYRTFTPIVGRNRVYGQCTGNTSFALQGGGTFSGIDNISVKLVPADKVQIFGGFKQSVLTNGSVLVELGPTADTTNGSIGFFPDAVAGSGIYQGRTRGTALIATNSTVGVPSTAVINFASDLAAPTQAMRRNGSQVGSGAGVTGGGNYAANPLYIGMRAGTSLPFNGVIYNVVTRFGPSLSTDQINATEAWINSRTGAY